MCYKTTMAVVVSACWSLTLRCDDGTKLLADQTTSDGPDEHCLLLDTENRTDSQGARWSNVLSCRGGVGDVDHAAVGGVGAMFSLPETAAVILELSVVVAIAGTSRVPLPPSTSSSLSEKTTKRFVWSAWRKSMTSVPTHPLACRHDDALLAINRLWSSPVVLQTRIIRLRSRDGLGHGRATRLNLGNNGGGLGGDLSVLGRIPDSRIALQRHTVRRFVRLRSGDDSMSRTSHNLSLLGIVGMLLSTRSKCVDLFGASNTISSSSSVLEALVLPSRGVS